MAKTPDFLARTPIDVPNRSGFAMPHEYMATGLCGTLIPVLSKRVVPGEILSEEVLFECELPPMVSNFFGRIDLCFEAFFVPNYLLWGGWDQFFTHPTANPLYPEGTPTEARPHNIPHIDVIDTTPFQAYLGRGTLADYLNLKQAPLTNTSSANIELSFNSLPFLAYHRIYHDHYRNSVVQAPVFYRPSIHGTTAQGSPYAAVMPYVSGVYADVAENNVRNMDADSLSNNTFSPILGDGVHILNLRQANFDLDYFTAATPNPQAGGAATITFDVVVDTDSGDGTGSLSISAIRSANSVQQWMERNNLVGYDYREQNFAQYGSKPKRTLDHSVYLGNYIEPVYNRSVFQTAPGTSTSSSNPFGTKVGARFGSPASNGRSQLFNNFKAPDHGYIMVMMSLRPHAYYGSGCDRDMFTRYVGDIPFPLLSSVGDQAILNRELIGFGVDEASTDALNTVFGYIDHYAHDKMCLDSIHGEFREGGVLEPFVLQRTFTIADGPLEISSDFLQIPTDFLDQVKQLNNEDVPVDYWVSVFHNFNKISPLPLYSVPTLGRLPNTHTEVVSRKKSTI